MFIIVSNKSANKMQQFYKFMTWCSYVAQHVSGISHPSSGAYNRTRSLWFYHWKEAAGALLVMVWPDHDQQCCNAPRAVVCSWWWAGRHPKHVEPHM